MQSADVLSRPARPPDLTLTYGRPDLLADLFLPPAGHGPAAAPLIVFVHGGFWRSAYDRKHAGPLAEALAAAGFAVCVPEYRRVGQDGGGWPGTFDDIRAAAERLPGLAAGAVAGRIGDASPVLAGHSAGGHLALWVAGQPAAAGVMAVVSLAGVCDLAACYRDGLGQGAAAALMGGGPDQFPERYQHADPRAALPVAAGVVLIHGQRDDRVPWRQSADYAAAASAAGAEPRCVLLPEADHFDLIDPLSAAWPAVLAGFRTAAGLGPTP
jgi:acetyl esterase/lipase